MESAEGIIQRRLDGQPRAADFAESQHVPGGTCKMGISIGPRMVARGIGVEAAVFAPPFRLLAAG